MQGVIFGKPHFCGSWDNLYQCGNDICLAQKVQILYLCCQQCTLTSRGYCSNMSLSWFFLESQKQAVIVVVFHICVCTIIDTVFVVEGIIAMSELNDLQEDKSKDNCVPCLLKKMVYWLFIENRV